MGITQWQLRNAAASAGFYHVRFRNQAEKTVGLMIAEINNTVSVVSQEQLLCKIAEAITTNYDIHQCESSNIGNDKYHFIIQLGGEVNFDLHSIHSHSLFDMICYPEKKKLLWIEIKKLRELFNE
jgi:DNA polymerase III psi subunit